ncbi:MAG: isoamylase early set domain-containing protein [Spirochaetales bacterium]|nr:isoamylase early set domain-containing protein [Spirochaetales bacterium]
MRVYRDREQKMNCTEFTRVLDAWLKDGNQQNFPAVLEIHARQCNSCSNAYKAAVLCTSRPWTPVQLPKDFTQEVMKKLTEEKTTGLLLENIRTAVYRLRKGFIPAAIATASVIVVLFIAGLFKFPAEPGKITIHLVYEAPQAHSVAVVGDWNDWDPNAHQLADPDRDGVWEIKLELTKNNEYRYQFYIDGDKWVPDPKSNLQVDDGFGGKNSVLGI